MQDKYIKFEEHLQVEIDAEIRTVRFSVSDTYHPKLRNYGDDYYYVHYTTPEDGVTYKFYEDLVVFFENFKRMRKNLKSSNYKNTWQINNENVLLHVRVNEKEPYAVDELVQLMEGILSHLESKYNIDDLYSQMTEEYNGGYVDNNYTSNGMSSDINSSDFASSNSSNLDFNDNNEGYNYNNNINNDYDNQGYNHNNGIDYSFNESSHLDSTQRAEFANQYNKTVHESNIDDLVDNDPLKQFEQKYDTYEPLDETEERMSDESTPFDSASSIDQDLNIENQIGFDLNKLNEPAKAPQLDEYNDLSSKERAIIELKNMNIDVKNNDFDIPVHNPDTTDIEAELGLTRSDADEEGEDSGDGDALLDALRSGKLDTDR